MLVLTRRIGEQINVPCCDVTIEVLRIMGSRVKLGVSAPRDTVVHRKEVLERIGEGVIRTGVRSNKPCSTL